MKTTRRGTPNRQAHPPGNREQGAEDQNRSSSHRWAAKQEKIQPMGLCFFLTSPFREQIRSLNEIVANSTRKRRRKFGRKVASHNQLDFRRGSVFAKA